MKKVLIILAVGFLVLGAVSKASDLIIDAKHQSYSEKDNKIKMDGNVEVKLDELNVVGDRADITINKNNEMDTATFYDKPYAFEVQDNKKREVKANILKLSLITKKVRAEGDVQTTVSDGRLPIVTINSDTQEYDTEANIMTAVGKVIIHYKELETFSNKAVIVTSKDGQLKKIDLYGEAKIVDGPHTSSADHFCYTSAKEELIGIGHVDSRSTMDDGTQLRLVSDFQQFDRKSNVFTGSGNAKAWYKDYYAEGPKMVFYPDKKTNKFNEIYFTGRSSITQVDKTVYADKIKMVLNPKTFYADGRTRTVIRNISSQKNEGL